MDKLTLTLPGSSSIPTPSGLKSEFVDLGSVLSGLLNIVFFVSLFLTFYYLIWGTWAYIFAGGEKEALAKAKERIKWALIGLLVVLMSYTIARYAGEIFPPIGGDLPF